MNSARQRAKKVFPTPVGPRKIKEPIGRRGSFRSARERLSALLRRYVPPATLPTPIVNHDEAEADSERVSSSSKTDPTYTPGVDR